MSLLAGFDMVTEFSLAALLRLIKSQVTLAGIIVNAPFEFDLTVAAGGLDGSVHVIVDDLTLNLNSDDSATLTFKFSNSSILGTTPALTITALDGSFTVKTPLGLVALGQNLMAPGANLGAATVNVAFSQAAQSKLSAGLGGTAISPAQFTSLAQSALSTLVLQQGIVPLGKGFKVVTGSTGALSPLQYERLELHCIVGSPTSQALGLFGILLVSHHSHGNAALKTAPALTAAHDVAVSISPDAFHSLVFCPAMASSLGASVSGLPKSCANAGELETQGVSLTKIADSFTSGHVDIDGEFAKSGFCYDASGTFHGELTFTVSGTTLTPSLALDQPEVDVSIPWYCGPASGFAIGVTALVGAAVVNAIAQGIADDYAEGAVDSVLGKSVPSQSISGITGVSFDQAAATSEGLTLNGLASIPMPPGTAKGLTLTGSVTTSDQSQVSSGNYTAILPLCPPKVFPYTEYAQLQTASYQAVPRLLGLPITLDWWILAGDGVTKVSLTGAAGTIPFPSQTFFALPLPAGNYVNDAMVHLTYAKSGSMLSLTNVPSEGTFTFALYAKATDPVGNVAEILVPGTSVMFEGNIVTIGGGYQDYAAQCMATFGKLMHRFRPHADLTFTPWVPVNYPSPDTLISYIRTIVASGDIRADEALAHAKLAHGSSFYRALFSPEAKDVGLRPKGISASDFEK